MRGRYVSSSGRKGFPTFTVLTSRDASQGDRLERHVWTPSWGGIEVGSGWKERRLVEGRGRSRDGPKRTALLWAIFLRVLQMCPRVPK